MHMIAIDFEASCLPKHGRSYPIEVGISEDGLTSRSWLIRPHISWTGWTWTEEAERLRRLSQVRLWRDGLPVERVATELPKRWASAGHRGQFARCLLARNALRSSGAALPGGDPIYQRNTQGIRSREPCHLCRTDPYRCPGIWKTSCRRGRALAGCVANGTREADAGMGPVLALGQPAPRNCWPMPTPSKLN